MYFNNDHIVCQLIVDKPAVCTAMLLYCSFMVYVISTDLLQVLLTRSSAVAGKADCYNLKRWPWFTCASL